MFGKVFKNYFLFPEFLEIETILKICLMVIFGKWFSENYGKQRQFFKNKKRSFGDSLKTRARLTMARTRWSIEERRRKKNRKRRTCQEPCGAEQTDNVRLNNELRRQSEQQAPHDGLGNKLLMTVWTTSFDAPKPTCRRSGQRAPMLQMLTTPVRTTNSSCQSGQ